MEQFVMQLVVEIDTEIDTEIRNIKNYKYFNIRKLQNSDIKQFHTKIDSEIDTEIDSEKTGLF